LFVPLQQSQYLSGIIIIIIIIILVLPHSLMPHLLCCVSLSLINIWFQ